MTMVRVIHSMHRNRGHLGSKFRQILQPTVRPICRSRKLAIYDLGAVSEIAGPATWCNRRSPCLVDGGADHVRHLINNTSIVRAKRRRLKLSIALRGVNPKGHSAPKWRNWVDAERNRRRGAAAPITIQRLHLLANLPGLDRQNREAPFVLRLGPASAAFWNHECALSRSGLQPCPLASMTARLNCATGWPS